MNSPNYRDYSKKEVWAQERAIIRLASPQFKEELIRAYHLRKFRPGRWEGFAPAVQRAAATLWWKKFLPTPAGTAYLCNGFSEPPHPHDPIMDRVGGSPGDQINGFEWQYPAVAFKKPDVQGELFPKTELAESSRGFKTANSKFALKKQLTLVADCDPELF